MILYLGKNHNTLNRKELTTEHISDYVCVNPIYSSVNITNPKAKIMIDSGAFQDRKADTRISFEAALERQLKLEESIGIKAYRIVSYDFIDNYEETVEANKFLVSKREELKGRQLMLMVQGETIEDYLRCLKETLDIADPEDCIGFGGVALAGKLRVVREKLYKIIGMVAPYLKNRDVHIFGVGTFYILRKVKELVHPTTRLSCDTSSYEIQSVMGKVISFEEEKWVKKYQKEDKMVNYHPCDLTLRNMKTAVKIVKSI